MEKQPFLWTEGRVNLKASLDKNIFSHGENIKLTLDLRNDSRKVVRKIRVSDENCKNFFCNLNDFSTDFYCAIC